MGGLVPNIAVSRAKVWGSDGIMRARSLVMDERALCGEHMTASLEGGGKQEARTMWRK